MARKRHKAEEIVSKLRQVDVLTAQGGTFGRGGEAQIGWRSMFYSRPVPAWPSPRLSGIRRAWLDVR